MGTKMTKQHCNGCRDNFYNGNNSLGVKECWMFSDATIIERKKIGTWQNPPWEQPSEQLPNCYSQDGYVIMNGNPKGWK